MWHSRPPRDPPPFMANAILNFHFDFLNPSLSKLDKCEPGMCRQHCRLSICENWLSWTNTETAAATPPTVMQNLLRASAQWLVLESAVFWLISPPTWVNWYLKMFLVHFTHYSGGESGNFVRNLWILSYNLSLKFGEALLLVRTEYWTNESFAPNLRSQWHIPQIWGEAPIGWILCADQ